MTDTITTFVSETEIVTTPVILGPPGATGAPGEPGPEGPPGVGTQGPPGPQGSQGAPGPEGPQGPAGTAIGNAKYEWKTSTAASDPAHGFIKCNNANPAAATEYYASVYDDGGAVVHFDNLAIGGTFTIYESGKLDTWDRYTVRGAVVVNGNEWFVIPVTFAASGPLPFTPGGNTQCEVQTPIKGEPGPAGPAGPQGIPGTTGTTGAQGPQGVKGDTGTAGTTGAQGVQGPKGDTGVSGAQGIQGIQGVKGDKGDTGITGSTGSAGAQGPAGPGVKVGGTTDQILAKASATDFDTKWVAAPSGGGAAPWAMGAWCYLNSTNPGAIGNGNFVVNNANWMNATILGLHYRAQALPGAQQASGQWGWDRWIEKFVKAGIHISVQTGTNHPSKYCRWLVTADATAVNSGDQTYCYYQVPIQFTDGAGDLAGFMGASTCYPFYFELG